MWEASKNLNVIASYLSYNENEVRLTDKERYTDLFHDDAKNYKSNMTRIYAANQLQ